MDVLKLKKLSKLFSKIERFSIPVLMSDYCLSQKDANFVFKYSLQNIDSFKGSIVLTDENHNLYNVKEIKGDLILEEVNSVLLWNCLKIIHGDVVIRSSKIYYEDTNNHEVYFDNIIIIGRIRKETIYNFNSFSSSTFSIVMENPNNRARVVLP